jgi:hypothetical protein
MREPLLRLMLSILPSDGSRASMRCCVWLTQFAGRPGTLSPWDSSDQARGVSAFQVVVRTDHLQDLEEGSVRYLVTYTPLPLNYYLSWPHVTGLCCVPPRHVQQCTLTVRLGLFAL